MRNMKDGIIITNSFKVKRSEELLSFLLNKMNTSRNNVKNILANNQVLVNGNVITQYNYMLANEDEVKISKFRLEKEKTKKEIRPRFEIIYEDENFIAINKRAGLLSVESDKDNNSAYKEVSKYLESKDKRKRCYVIHRIDKETSGVLVFTLNPKIHSILRLNWNDYIVDREYFAIVEGKLKNKKDRLINYLDNNEYNLVYITNKEKGKIAITNYEVLKENNEYSMLRVLIETGRKNQIRVQLHNIGNPIIGDDKYGFNKNPIKRLGLHASKMSIKNPLNGEIITFIAKIPNEFTALFR